MAKQRNAGVLVAPDRVHDGQRYQHPSGDHGIDFTELAGLGAAADDTAEKPESAGSDFVGVESREVRELVELAEYEAVQGVEDWRADERPVSAHGAVELLAWRTALASRFFACLDGGDGSLPHYFAEELFFIREVEVDGAFGDSGTGGDVLEASLGESAFAKDFERGLNDLLGPVFGSSAPLWRFSDGF